MRTDGLTVIGHAVEPAIPMAVHQTYVVHLIRSALRFVAWGDRKRVSAALKPLYRAEREQVADLAMVEACRRPDAHASFNSTFW